MKDKVLSDITSSKVNELNQEFKENYNVTFTKLYNKHFNGHLQENKKTENSHKVVKAAFKNCEEQWQQSSIERYVFFKYIEYPVLKNMLKVSKIR